MQAVAGPLQLCAGQIAGTEAAVYVVRSLFGHADSDAILLVDASNAFNSLNRSVALHNIQKLCPSLACVLINTYRSPASLFVSGDRGNYTGRPTVYANVCHYNDSTDLPSY